MDPITVIPLGFTGLYAQLVPYGTISHIFSKHRVEVRLSPDHPNPCRKKLTNRKDVALQLQFDNEEENEILRFRMIGHELSGDSSRALREGE